MFQTQDNVEDGYCPDMREAGTALLLILLRQQRQRLQLEQLTLHQEGTEKKHNGLHAVTLFFKKFDVRRSYGPH